MEHDVDPASRSGFAGWRDVDHPLASQTPAYRTSQELSLVEQTLRPSAGAGRPTRSG